MLTNSGAGRSLVPLVLAVALGLSACRALPPSAHVPGASPGAAAAADASGADAACTAIVDDIPLVKVRSGKASLAAAYEVTGEQLAGYLEATAARVGFEFRSAWRDDPAEVVDMCVFDGDFTTNTPGPPGSDRSAVRVLVVVSGGRVQLWSVGKTKSALPTDDPASMSQ